MNKDIKISIYNFNKITIFNYNKIIKLTADEIIIDKISIVGLNLKIRSLDDFSIIIVGNIRLIGELNEIQN